MAKPTRSGKARRTMTGIMMLATPMPPSARQLTSTNIAVPGMNGRTASPRATAHRAIQSRRLGKVRDTSRGASAPNATKHAAGRAVSSPATTTTHAETDTDLLQHRADAGDGRPEVEGRQHQRDQDHDAGRSARRHHPVRQDRPPRPGLASAGRLSHRESLRQRPSLARRSHVVLGDPPVVAGAVPLDA